jgi:hypothetical protein
MNNTTKTNQVPKLAIKLNKRITDSCPFCLSAINANIGIEIVDDETDLPVCKDCAIKYALDLAYLINLAEVSRLLAISERDFGVKFEKEHFPEAFGGLNWNGFDENNNVIQFPKQEVAAR